MRQIRFRQLLFWAALVFFFFSPFLLRAQNWTQVSEIGNQTVNAIAEHSGILFAATDSTIYRSLDGGLSWSLTPQSPTITGYFSTLFGHGNYLYLGSRGDGVFRSADSGRTWQSLSSGLTGFARNIVQFAVIGDSLYVGTDGSGIYVLNLQNPAAWSAFNTGLFQFGTTSLITSGTTLVASLGQYVFVRPKSAAQWTDTPIDSIGSRTPTTLFRMDSSIFLGTSGGIFRADTNGINWQRKDITQFANQEIVGFTSHQSRLFAGLNYLSDHWIFSTDNSGTTWDIRAHEFASVLDLYVAHGRLWAARTDGLWWYDLNVWTDVKEIPVGMPSTYELSQNYPNPFNPSTEIRYRISDVSVAVLKVYDVLGREVATLVNERKQPGEYSVQWDASTMPSGMYYYRLRAGDYTAVKKMMVMK